MRVSMFLMCAAGYWLPFFGTIARCETVFSRVDACGLVNESILVPAAQFHMTNIEKLARAFVQKAKAGHKLGMLTIATSSNDLVRMLHKGDVGPSSPCLGGLDDLVKCVNLITRQPGLQGPAARVWFTDDAAVVDYILDHKLRRKILAGQGDPKRIVVQNVEFRLLSMSIAKVNAATGGSTSCVVSFYLQSKAVSFSSGFALTKHMTAITSAKTVTVSVRRDPWYLSDPGFPEILPFEADAPSPSASSFILNPELSCHVNNGQLRCSGKGFEP